MYEDNVHAGFKTLKACFPRLGSYDPSGHDAGIRNDAIHFMWRMSDLLGVSELRGAAFRIISGESPTRYLPTN